MKLDSSGLETIRYEHLKARRSPKLGSRIIQQPEWAGPISIVFSFLFSMIVLMSLIIINQCMKLQLWATTILGIRSQSFFDLVMLY